MEEFARRHGAQLLPTYNKSVTHVIVRIDEDKNAERTLKFLYGVAARKWVVSIDWVLECQRQKRLIDEEPYEVLDMDGENGPWKARNSTELLFHAFEFCCVEPFSDITIDQLRELLELCGALTVDSPVDLRRGLRYSFIIVQGDPSKAHYHHIGQTYFERHKAVCVSREWVLDCIASYQIYPVRYQIFGMFDAAALNKLGLENILGPENPLGPEILD